MNTEWWEGAVRFICGWWWLILLIIVLVIAAVLTYHTWAPMLGLM